MTAPDRECELVKLTIAARQTYKTSKDPFTHDRQGPGQAWSIHIRDCS